MCLGMNFYRNMGKNVSTANMKAGAIVTLLAARFFFFFFFYIGLLEGFVNRQHCLNF